jgi:hypothetical protein
MWRFIEKTMKRHFRADAEDGELGGHLDGTAWLPVKGV